jgi:hypothetical protein
VPGVIELNDTDEEVEDEPDVGRGRWSRREKPEYLKFIQPLDDEAMKNLALRNASVTDLDEVGVFEKIFDDSVVQLLVKQSTLCAHNVKNDHEFIVTADEIRTFLAILIFSGYNSLPSEKMYWSNDEDIGVELVRAAMSCDRFLQIKK